MCDLAYMLQLRMLPLVPGGPPGSTPFQRLLLLACLLIGLPFMVMYSTNVLMVTTYTGNVFHLSGFLAQYHSSIYRYRLLGPWILIKVYGLLTAHKADVSFPLPQDPNATSAFYGAYTLVNGAFYFASNALLVLFLWRRKEGMGDVQWVVYFFFTLMLALSMAVVTPYDQLAYFLLLVGIWGIRLRPHWVGWLLVAVSAVLGMMNRETELLLASVLAALALVSKGGERKRLVSLLLLQIGLSLAVYIGLRVIMHGSHAVTEAATLGGRHRAVGLLMQCTSITLAALLGRRICGSLRPSLLFLAFSVPYIVPILLTGQLLELRLGIPLILCMLSVAMLFDRNNLQTC